MKPQFRMLMIIAAGLIAATPAMAQRSHGGHGGHGGYGHNHFWGPVGFLLGTAIVYSALQPRTVYYTPPVVYAPPIYAPTATYVQPHYVEQVYGSPPGTSPPPPYVAQSAPLESAGGQWWYFCNKPAGYYPYIKECPSGWEKVSPTPPGPVRP